MSTARAVTRCTRIRKQYFGCSCSLSQPPTVRDGIFAAQSQGGHGTHTGREHIHTKTHRSETRHVTRRHTTAHTVTQGIVVLLHDGCGRDGRSAAACTEFACKPSGHSAFCNWQVPSQQTDSCIASTWVTVMTGFAMRREEASGLPIKPCFAEPSVSARYFIFTHF